ncbi:hypothetical protein SSABA_v1c01430 [Spiroplasma sabaudiense Ar-1343]|uniref:Uncharacterized protein n=1 Tax=Spiroplasma sabaudiense Ar-1343 TaxID=1276257 RepID=W6A9J3_9MOLU|nr:hypothetical protein [Spiroplasma sabaudiense]AHI53555.1 hypothetical protein SSABA_v1c01430 [Spiroplasma sabaudiense Ar-1343]
MDKRTWKDYEKIVEKIMDEEMLLLKLSPEFYEFPITKSIIKFWQKTPDVFKFQKFLEKKMTELSQEADSEVEDLDDFSEIIFIRIMALTTTMTVVIKNFNQKTDLFWKKRFKEINNADHNFLIHLVPRIVGNHYLQNFEFEIRNLIIPESLSSFGNRVLNRITKISQEDNIENFFEQLYELQESFEDMLESVSQTEVDISDQELNEAGLFFNWSMYVEASLYFLLLIHENLLAIEEENTKLLIQEEKYHMINREEKISELKFINNEMNYNEDYSKLKN